MAVPIALQACRQGTTQATVIHWGADAGPRGVVLVVARRRLLPEEIVRALGGAPGDAEVVPVPAGTPAVVDDVTGAGEACYYGVFSASGSTPAPVRFRAGAMSEMPQGTARLSAARERARAGVRAPTRPPDGAAVAATSPGAVPAPAGVRAGSVVTGAVRAVPASTTSAGLRVPATGPAREAVPRPAAADVVTGATRAHTGVVPAGPGPGAVATGSLRAGATTPGTPLQAVAAEARRQAQLRAQQAAAAVPVSTEDPREARRQAQIRAEQGARAVESPPPEVGAPASRAAVSRGASAAVDPSSAFPIDRFGLPMIGANQSWDGLRIQWEDEGKGAAAWEVFVADHPLHAEEVGELLRGERVPGAFVRAFAAGVRAVIDNRTDRDSRMYCGVVARRADGERFPVGCTALSSDRCQVLDAPLLDPERVEAVRELARAQVREARAQLHWWKAEQDVGAWREALRVVGDALAIAPGFTPALELKAEILAARRV